MERNIKCPLGMWEWSWVEGWHPNKSRLGKIIKRAIHKKLRRQYDHEIQTSLSSEPERECDQE